MQIQSGRTVPLRVEYFFSFLKKLHHCKVHSLFILYLTGTVRKELFCIRSPNKMHVQYCITYKRFGGSMPLFFYLFYFWTTYTFIRHSFITFAEAQPQYIEYCVRNLPTVYNTFLHCNVQYRYYTDHWSISEEILEPFLRLNLLSNWCKPLVIRLITSSPTHTMPQF